MQANASHPRKTQIPSSCSFVSFEDQCPVKFHRRLDRYKSRVIVRPIPRTLQASESTDERASPALSAMAEWEDRVADSDTKIDELKALVRKFAEERDWQPFHSPKNLAMGVAVEAAELMECFLWVDAAASYQTAKDKREAVADEVADVFCYLLNMSNVIGLDLSEALKAKLIKNAQKYPAEKYKGKYEVK